MRTRENTTVNINRSDPGTADFEERELFLTLQNGGAVFGQVEHNKRRIGGNTQTASVGRRRVESLWRRVHYML